MFGRGLVTTLVAAAAASAAAVVIVVSLGAAVFYLLSGFIPAWAAAACTALVFALAGFIAYRAAVGAREAEDAEEEEEVGITDRAIALFKQRPILGTVAALAAGFIFLRNPALTTLVAAAFTEKAHTRNRGRRR
ncbi:hypothetical protein Q0812_12315 [Brevundimonas sp. 2R-24]|uniref:Uncharacterized protein n=1 Tax=Peiella sedimenti TaxID=3061083 RepID=A0ABT8SRJ8_9CAUL|nr:hypothetical protein [Caulobacteraceae bacterium XZ-24]